MQWNTNATATPHPWRALAYDYHTNSTAVLGPLEIKTFLLQVE